MGNIIIAVCSCGLRSKRIFQGVGFNSCKNGYSCEPAYCDDCGIVVGVDSGPKEPICPSCNKKAIFYKDWLNKRRPKDSDIPNFLEQYLTFSKHLESGYPMHCPNCKQINLKFETIGLWD